MRKAILIAAALLSVAWAQEVVSPLHYNTNLPKQMPMQMRAASALSLPFFDDFSNYKGYPNPNLWQDMDAFVNTTYPIEPLNIGVATLDGLDAEGNPYNMATPTAHGPADSLTSQPIDLSPYTEAYISFYYQPQGLGNAPENNDVLYLYFFNDNEEWVEVWSTEGTANTDFVEAQLSIADPSYLHDAFQFCFHNEATLSGSFDHWHLDNILVTEDANLIADKNDVAFVYESSKTLKYYWQMPWEHYKANALAFTLEDMEVVVRNNFSSSQPVNYMYDIQTSGWAIHYPVDVTNPANFNNSRNDDVHAYSQNGLFSYSEHTQPAVDIYEDLVYPTSNTDGVFTIVQSLATNNSTNALFAANDTLRFTQEFANYYALDDGSAEASYGLNVAGGMAAMRFNLAKSDTLKAVQIHFEQSLEDVSATAFKITVWASDNYMPGEMLYQSQVFYPEYTDVYNGYYEYVLEEAVKLSGNVFIGWEQFYPNIINIGLDKNTINNDRMYFNTGSEWEMSACAECSGTWMLRPVFGSVSTSAVMEHSNTLYSIYPNPVQQYLNIEAATAFTAAMYNLSGQLVYSSHMPQEVLRITSEHLAKGMYVLELQSEGVVHREIIIVQ